MNHAMRSRLIPGWTVAALVAGLLMTATIGQAVAAAPMACPGGALTLSNAVSATQGIAVDDDLLLQLNGTTFYENNDEWASILAPIQFSAAYGDQLRVVASNSTVFGGNQGLDSLALYCDANGSSQVLEPSQSQAGNGPNGAVFYDKTFTIDFTGADATDPSVTITTPPDGAVYLLDQVVLADYACADEAGGSGLATCTGDVADGAAIDTSTVGTHTFAVTGTDNAGNSTTVTHAYAVRYDFGGFFQPVDNLPVVNSVKAGSAIPIKFSLDGDQGLAIFATDYPKSQVIACGAGGSVDGIEQTLTAGSSSLTYDAGTDQYVYVWKTEKSWAGTCRQLVVKLIDGTSTRANFLFK